MESTKAGCVNPQALPRPLDRLHEEPGRGIGARAEKRHAADARDGLAQQLELLAGGLGVVERNSGDVPAWAREVADEARPPRVRDARQHNGYFPRGTLGRLGGQGARGHDDAHLQAHEVRRELTGPLAICVRRSPLDGEVLALDIAELAQAQTKSLHELIASRELRETEDADARHGGQRLGVGRGPIHETGEEDGRGEDDDSLHEVPKVPDARRPCKHGGARAAVAQP